MKNGIVAVLTLASFCINFMMLLPPMRLAVPPVEDLYQKLLLPQNETLVSTDMVLVQNYTYVFSWSCSGQELQSFASQYFQQYRSTLPIQWQSGCNGIQWWNTNNDDDISWMKGGAALQGLFLVMLTLPVIFAAIYLYMAFKWAGDEKLRRLRSLPAVGCWLGFAVTWVMWFLLPMGYQCFPVDLQESIPQGFNNFDGRSFSIDPSAFSPTEYLRCTTAGQVSLSPSDMVRYAIWETWCGMLILLCLAAIMVWTLFINGLCCGADQEQQDGQPPQQQRPQPQAPRLDIQIQQLDTEYHTLAL